MSKIVIIGHPDSGHTKVEEMLHRCGMRQPNPSRRDQLSACEVIQSICKSAKAPNVEDCTGSVPYRQIRPSSVWDGLVLDLMLGNLEQDLWGWADSQALLLMEYLAEVDDNLTFILVYDSPGSVLLKLSDKPSLSRQENVHHQRLDQWVAYNAELLHFFLRHRSRSILVHVDSVTHAVEKTLSMLQARLSAPLQTPGEKEVAGLQSDGHPGQGDIRIMDVDPMLNGALAASGQPETDAVGGFLAQDAETFLLDSFLSGHPSSRQLYEELQASSNLPFEPDQQTGTSPDSAWNAFLNQRWFIGQLLAKIQGKNRQLENDNRQLSEEHAHLQKQIASTRTQLSDRDDRVARLEVELRTQAAALGEAKQAVGDRDGRIARLEDELRTQAAAVVEAKLAVGDRDGRIARLEEELRTQTAALEKARKAVSDRDGRVSQLQNELRSQTAALEEARKAVSDRDGRVSQLENELQSLTATLEEARKAANDLDGNLEKSIDEIELLKEHISISSEQFEQLERKWELVGAQLESAIRERDRIRLENQRIQQDATQFKKNSESFLAQLHQTQEQLESVYLENRKLKQPPAQPDPPPPPEGAVDRIKSQLSYRIGSLMVQRSKSIQGLVTLPFSMIREIRSFHEERIRTGRPKLPPLSEYADAHLAERVKSQLSYQLGNIVVHNAKSPLGWMRMPFAILHCTRTFHKRRLDHNS